MYKLKKNGLKWLKVLHLICACCWLGGALALFAINLHQSRADSQPMLHGMNLSAHLVDVWIIIIPGANGCLLTGLIYGLFTNWGFVKHRWIAVKWLLTITAMVSGTFLLGVWEGRLLELSSTGETVSTTDAEYARIMTKHITMACVQIAMLCCLWSGCPCSNPRKARPEKFRKILSRFLSGRTLVDSRSHSVFVPVCERIRQAVLPFSLRDLRETRRTGKCPIRSGQVEMTRQACGHNT